MKFVTEKEGATVIFTLAQRVEWEDARLIDDAIKGCIDQGNFNIAFDLNNVGYICSAGIGALVYNLNTAKSSGGAIYIISSNEYMEYLFQTLMFDVVFSGYIFPSREAFRRHVVEGSSPA
jgi:anti-anti-sigma factor